MPAYYDFYQTPQPKGGSKRKKFHARVVSTHTVTLDDLAGQIHDSSSLTVGDVIGTSTLLVKYLISALQHGRRVYIPGLGYFQLSISCPPVQSTSEIRAESIKGRSIIFRPDLEAKHAIKRTTFVRVAEKRHSKERSSDDIDRLLTAYFATNRHITRRQFQGLCGLTPSTAYRRLRDLISEGRLRTEGEYRHFPAYVPAEGHFGR